MTLSTASVDHFLPVALLVLTCIGLIGTLLVIIMIAKKIWALKRASNIREELAGVLMKMPHGIAIYEKGNPHAIYRNQQNKEILEAKHYAHLCVREETYDFKYRGAQYTLCVQMDITELENSRFMATRSVRLKNQFLTNTTQDLQEPLEQIVKYAALIRDRYEQGDIQEYADAVEKNTAILLHHIDEIIDLSQLQADAAKNRKPAWFDIKIIADTVQEELAQHKHLMQSGGEVQFEVTRNFDTLLTYADASRLTRVVHSMVTHSLRRTQEGRVHVDFDYNSMSNLLTVRICDTSGGMSAQDMEHLFEPKTKHLFEIDSSYVFAFHIAQVILHHVGGTIDVSKHEDNGLCVCISYQPTLHKQRGQETIDATRAWG